MTIEELLGYDSEKLKTFTDDQLLDLFGPYLTACRVPVGTKSVSETKVANKSSADKTSKEPRKSKARQENEALMQQIQESMAKMKELKL